MSSDICQGFASSQCSTRRIDKTNDTNVHPQEAELPGPQTTTSKLRNACALEPKPLQRGSEAYSIPRPLRLKFFTADGKLNLGKVFGEEFKNKANQLIVVGKPEFLNL